MSIDLSRPTRPTRLTPRWLCGLLNRAFSRAGGPGARQVGLQSDEGAQARRPGRIRAEGTLGQAGVIGDLQGRPCQTPSSLRTNR